MRSFKVKMENSDKLYRSSSSNYEPEILVLIGNGAIENGDDVFQNVISELENKKAIKSYAQLCAVHTYQFRSLRNTYLSECITILKYNRITNDDKKRWNRDLDRFLNYRQSIAAAFRKTYRGGELKLRSSSAICDLLQGSKVGVVTLNWDECIWANAEIKNLIYLHGSVKYPQSMIMPNELSHDEDIYGIGAEVTNEVKLFEKFYRGDYRKDLTICHVRAGQWMRSIKKLIIWGVAFNVYDAELMTLLYWWHANKNVRTRNVIIINSNEDHVKRTKELLKIEEDNIPCDVLKDHKYLQNHSFNI